MGKPRCYFLGTGGLASPARDEGKVALLLNTRELPLSSIKHESHLELMTSRRNEAMRVRPAPSHSLCPGQHVLAFPPTTAPGGEGGGAEGEVREEGAFRSILRVVRVLVCAS